MENQEKIRLLLIDGTKENRASNISNGVGNIFGRWPSYIASAIWCIICLISIVILIIVLTIFLVINERYMNMNSLGEVVHSQQKLNNEFCKRVTERDNHLAGRSIELLNPDTMIEDTSENLFYSLLEPLNRMHACAVESVLRLCPDKFIYLMYFDKSNKGSRKGLRYENILRRRYSNLNELHADGDHYVKSSPFEGQWKKDNASVLATNILTVWQFGGTALSKNLIMKSRKMLDSSDSNCLVDREFIFCPEQCSHYIYELIATLNKNINDHKGNNTEEVINLSIAEFCGGSDYSRTGCAGVKRIDDSLMCTTETQRCLFIRLEEWSRNDKKWELTAAQYCPEIMKLRLI